MQTLTSTSASHAHEELMDFCTKYIGQKSFELGPVANHLNRISLRKAPVVSVELVRGHRRELRVTLDIIVEEDQEAIRQVLHESFVPDAPRLSVLIYRTFADDSRGGKWQHKIEFVHDPMQKAGEGSKILMHGSFHNLRLYHIMDLVRIISTEFKSVPPTPDLAAFPNDEDFALVTMGVIHRFSYDWERGAQPVNSMFPRAHPDILKTLKISNWFFRRWCKEDPPQLFSLEDFSSWNDGTVRTLLSRPRDRGPLFWFEEDRYSFRKRFTRQDILGYSLKSFCDHILHGVDPLESSATIVGLTRYKEPDGFQHEFVILHARLPTSVWNKGLEFCIRIDRAAVREATGGSSRSIFPADDKAHVALKKEDLLGKSRAKERVTLYLNSRKFNVRELAKLLEIFSEEAPEYVLATNNCYFLASLIQETVTKYTDCSPAEHTWAKRIPTETFGKIMKRYDATCSVSSLVSEVSDSDSTQSRPTSSLDPCGRSASAASSRSRRASLARVTRKFTGIFQRRWSGQSRVLTNSGDLTAEPETMDVEAGGESPIVPNNGVDNSTGRNWRVKRPTLSGFVRNMFQQGRNSTKVQSLQVPNVAQPFDDSENGRCKDT